jgi:hypothetical protein
VADVLVGGARFTCSARLGRARGSCTARHGQPVELVLQRRERRRDRGRGDPTTCAGTGFRARRRATPADMVSDLTACRTRRRSSAWRLPDSLGGPIALAYAMATLRASRPVSPTRTSRRALGSRDAAHARLHAERDLVIAQNQELARLQQPAQALRRSRTRGVAWHEPVADLGRYPPSPTRSSRVAGPVLSPRRAFRHPRTARPAVCPTASRAVPWVDPLVIWEKMAELRASSPGSPARRRGRGPAIGAERGALPNAAPLHGTPADAGIAGSPRRGHSVAWAGYGVARAPARRSDELRARRRGEHRA